MNDFLANRAAKEMPTNYQWNKFIEEMAELTAAVYHFHQDKISLGELEHEIADVEVSLKIIMELCRSDSLTERIDTTWELVQKRLDTKEREGDLICPPKFL